MIGKPKIDERSEQQYMGIRVQTPMRQFKKIIPQLLDELFAWLDKQGIEPAGPPFMRYHVINMDAAMDVEMGVPVANAVAGDGRVSPGVIPAGRYAALIYTGVTNGIKGNGALLNWGAQNGLQWDRWDDRTGAAARRDADGTSTALVRL